MKLFGKEVSWKLLIVLTILLSPFIYNLDAIQGWIKFEIMCRKEGGVRFYGHAERNSGWLVKGRTHGEDSSRSAVSSRTCEIHFRPNGQCGNGGDWPVIKLASPVAI